MGNECCGKMNPKIDHTSPDRESKLRCVQENIIQNFKNEMTHLLIEEKQNRENEEVIGDWLNTYSEELYQKLPIYIIFNIDEKILIDKCINCCKNAKSYWNNITELIDKTVLINSEEPVYKIFKTYQDCSLYFEKIEDNLKEKYEVENKNIFKNEIIKNIVHKRKINFYEKEITPFIIYKKFKIKYDFYYIPIHIYNQVKLQTDIIKTIQILELLGSDQININVTEINNSENNILSQINTGFVSNEMSINQKNEKNMEINRNNSYEYLDKLFTNEEELLTFINLQPYIFMDLKDYEGDIELKYLIRSRINSYLNSYSKSFNIQKLSSIETKIQTKISKLHQDLGLDFSYSNQEYKENNIILEATFFNLDNISNINNLPLNAIGFKIITERFKEEEEEENTENFLIKEVETCENNKYIREVNRFYEKILKKEYDILLKKQQKGDKYKFNNSYLKYHYELKKNNNIYRKLTVNIETFNDINNLLNIIKYNPYFTPINREGFNLMIYKSLYPLTNYLNIQEKENDEINKITEEYYYEYFKRYSLLNNISLTDYNLYISSLTEIDKKDIIEHINNFDNMTDLIIEVFFKPEFIPIQEKYIQIICNKIHFENIDKSNNYYLLYNRILQKEVNTDNYQNIDYKSAIYEKISERLDKEDDKISYYNILTDIENILNSKKNENSQQNNDTNNSENNDENSQQNNDTNNSESNDENSQQNNDTNNSENNDENSQQNNDTNNSESNDENSIP